MLRHGHDLHWVNRKSADPGLQTVNQGVNEKKIFERFHPISLSDHGLNIGSLIMYFYISSSVSILSFKEYPSTNLNQFTQCWKQLFETHEIDWNVRCFACKICAFSRVIQISIQWINVIREDKGYQISSQEGLTCLQIVKFAQTNFSFVQKSFCCFNWISNLTEDKDVINFGDKLVPQSY